METAKLREVLNMNVTEYKLYHESYMENNEGSSAIHTFACIFLTVQSSLFCAVGDRYPDKFQLVLEYLFIILPMILVHTVWPEQIYLFNSVMCTILVYQFMSYRPYMEIMRTFTMPNSFRNTIEGITCMRGLTYLITVFCILAVDFQSFPRYLAKTEKYGYSLMDTGVALFVLMSGLVHKDARGTHIQFKKNSLFVIILIGLGLIRYISIKQLEYQEHVTEYGVHWNFFFTLAICKLLSAIILRFTNKTLMASTVILILHEVMLAKGLEQLVFSNLPRTTLFLANREGIISCLGYVSLYLFAVQVRKVLYDSTVPRYAVFFKLFLGSGCLWVLAFTLNIFRPTSRTLANAGYCLFLGAVLLTVMTLLYVYEILFQDAENELYFNVPIIIKAVNSNGLFYFLISNLMTGAINMTVRTLSVSPRTTFIILNWYMVITTLLAICMARRNTIL